MSLCDCKRMKFEFSKNRYCTQCGHVRMQHYSVFKQRVSTPVLRYGYKGAKSP